MDWLHPKGHWETIMYGPVELCSIQRPNLSCFLWPDVRNVRICTKSLCTPKVLCSGTALYGTQINEQSRTHLSALSGQLQNVMLKKSKHSMSNGQHASCKIFSKYKITPLRWRLSFSIFSLHYVVSKTNKTPLVCAASLHAEGKVVAYVADAVDSQREFKSEHWIWLSWNDLIKCWKHPICKCEKINKGLPEEKGLWNYLNLAFKTLSNLWKWTTKWIRYDISDSFANASDGAVYH